MLSLVVATLCFVLVASFIFAKRRPAALRLKPDTLEPPSPMGLPIIGHMHLLGGYEVPYQAFTELKKKFGNVVKLQLGTVSCVVVNGRKNIREALVTKGHHFDYRPDFERYRRLFSGNKQNSLAFCDWSATQKTRRNMLKAYTFPRAFSNNFFELDDIIAVETRRLVNSIVPGVRFDLKPQILKTCANIFTTHFCSETFDADDAAFTRMTENFDEIFYEVNQGYAADFLPFLLPLHQKNLQRMTQVAREIREFINRDLLKNKYEDFDGSATPSDYLESLIGHVKKEGSGFDMETALFALEDILGGHSAVGNFLMKLFGFLAKEPEVQRKVQAEIASVVGGERPVSICDRNRMPYTEAVIFEAIRVIASPIVPRVANQTSSIDGYRIEKGTLLFLNNYDLSTCPELWAKPDKFQPERFVRDGKLHKPDHFLPFGGGRRSCMGYKLVQLVSFGVVGTVLQNFTIVPVEGENYRVPVGSLALKKDTFKFGFEKRRGPATLSSPVPL
ncbi:cytochrome P450 307a1-like [Cylas formicarius]|uniref:cytochrome P450 307a1-like n=1 Tax=Cylas formicarius TaxID=197179 RepID=UPI002958CA29|nr:cytochrome P450 307a1-like [Cylas formicarius]XP_060533619.1 cytochrome P450 307a1-like [Cylas formicarius]